MELSQDMIIDIALNATGYIAAAGLMLTLFSLFRKKSGTTATSPVEVAVPDKSATIAVKSNGSGARMEFLKLSGDAPESVRQPGPEVENKPDAGRRDRSEIIRVAREMLKAGATIDKITSILPISQAELAMLSAGRR